MNNFLKNTIYRSNHHVSGFRRLWKDILESITGSERDYTQGSLGRAIFLLSVPMVLEMSMESIFAIVDIKFVTRLGADAVATVGITESLMTIVYAIGFGFSMATTAVVSRRIGEKHKREASVAAAQSIVIGILVSILLAIPGLFYAKDLLILMGASEEIISEGYIYPEIMISSNIVIMLLFIINAVFRSSGDAAISMRVLFLANILNLILDPLLIFGLGPIPALGLKGAAIATATGRGLAVLYQFYLLFKGNGRIRLSIADFIPRWKIIHHLVNLSYGGIGQNIIATSSWIVLMRIMNSFGSEAVAGYTIAIRIIIFSLLPSWGIANAASTLTGQNLGANKPDRAERSVWATSYVNAVFLFLIGLIMISFPEFFIRLLTDDGEVVKHGKTALRIISYGYLFYSFGMVMPQAFNGAGDTNTPTWINFFCFWLIEIPLAYILALYFHWDEKGVFYAIVIAESCMALMGIWLFKRGKWKLKKV